MPNGLASRVSQHRWLSAGAVAVLALVVVTAVLGGFRTAPTPPVPDYQAGQPAASAILTVDLRRAWLASSSVAGVSSRYSGHDYLLLDAWVENRTRKPLVGYLGQDLRWLSADAGPEPHKGIPAHAVFHAGGHAFVQALQPHLPTHVLISWELPTGARAPATARWMLRGRRFKAHTNLTTESAWLPAPTAATFTLPVVDERMSEARSP